MKNIRLSISVRAIVFLCGIALIVVLFVPLWQIELAAPQYPEGLVLKMHPHKLAGNVDIINGLNHYIGMKTLHTDDFVEFTVLPYIISFFAAFCLLVAVFLNRTKWLVILFSSFVLFGIVAMADFYRWNYDYGHNLDPNAAIQVPGMSYQPPLIGYKKLLNFGAYSIPDIGGWLFIGVGLLLMFVVFSQFKSNKKIQYSRVNKTLGVVIVFFSFGLMSCNVGPQPIKIGVDACSFCKMSIADHRFGAEIITKKGKIFKFDDIHCLVEFRKSKVIDNKDIKETFLVRFNEPYTLTEASQLLLWKSNDFRSPMGGNIAGFTDENKLNEAAERFKGEKVSLESVLNGH